MGGAEKYARVCVLRAEGDGVSPALVLQLERGPWSPVQHGTSVGPPQYLFACPEGISRWMLTHRRVLFREEGDAGPSLPSPSLAAIFATEMCPDQVGGLAGLMLRLKADGHEKVHTVGPAGLLAHLTSTLEQIVWWKHPAVLVSEAMRLRGRVGVVATPVVYADAHIEVSAAFGTEDEIWSDEAHTLAVDPRQVRDLCIWEDASFASPSAPASGPPAALCVRLKGCNGAIFVILECRSTHQLDSVRQSKFWRYVQTCASSGLLLAVLHRSPGHVTSTVKFQDLVSSCGGGGSVRHVDMFSASQREFAFTGSLNTLAKLSQVDASVFPMPVVAPERRRCVSGVLSCEGRLVTISVGADGSTSVDCTTSDPVKEPADLTLLGEEEGGIGGTAPSVHEPCVAEARNGRGGNMGAADAIRSLLARNKRGPSDGMPLSAQLPKRARQLPGVSRIHFLGTGCAEPSKYRGGTGILVEFPVGGCLLLDAGESVWGQMIRTFGRTAALAKLNATSCVWVSHKHADHVLGLASVLHHRAAPGKMLVVGPYVVHKWLRQCAYGNLEGRYIFKHHSHINRGDAVSSQFFSAMGLSMLRSVEVEHCRDAFALLLEHRAGLRLAFSGDTRPCRAFVSGARQAGTSVLIHEATFESKYSDHAVKKRHCTITEVLGVAQEVGAALTVFTHLSQRYPGMPDEIRHAACLPGAPAQLLAFDGMCLEVRGPQAVLPEGIMARIGAALDANRDVTKDEEVDTEEDD